MNGPEHFREAERLIAYVTGTDGNIEPHPGALEVLSAAQVHATLALAAALQPAGRAWADVTRYEKPVVPS